MSTSHLDRKELKRPDAFMSSAGNFIEFVNKNAKSIVAALALLFALGLAMAFYSSLGAKKAEEAESAFYEARKALAEQLAKAPGNAEAATSDIPADWAQKAKDGIEKVEKVAKDYSGTRAAFEAYLLLGDIHFVRKDAAKAVEYFKKAVSEARPRSAKPTALYALGYAYEQTKEYDKEIDAMRQVVGSSDVVLKPDAMLALGRAHALKGDKPKALDAYNQVIKDFPNTQAAQTAESQISRLK